MSSRSTWTIVRPPSPPGTPLRANTFEVNSASLATSNMYEMGRTPVEVAFSITSRIGCCDSLYLKPCPGSRSFGGVIFTPAIGPATDGLSGLELFCASHPASANDRTAGSSAAEMRFIAIPRRYWGARRRGGPDYRPETISSVGTELLGDL